MGQIYTFYSYKGGVGRSMALVNISVMLSKLGYKTLIIDWDLEAPGLEMFFDKYINLSDIRKKEGIIDILAKLQEDNGKTYKSDLWINLINKIKIPNQGKEIHFITSGKRDENYFEKVRGFDIEKIYMYNENIVEQIRDEWKNDYDFVLIDSRTGITDYGGICTIHLPDILVLFYITNVQNLDGVIDIYKKSKKARKQLPYDRKSLISLPILSRFDSSEEYKISQEWIERAANHLSEIYKNWLPKEISVKEFIEITKIPYIPYFSFGEKIAVLEQSSKDPAGIVYAYETLSAILSDDLENVLDITKNREAYIGQHSSSTKQNSDSEDYTKKIFISYAKEDKSLATEFYDKLVDFGFNARWNEDLRKGAIFKDEIKNIIRGSDIFLSLITKNYTEEKPNILSEISFALETYQTKLSKNYSIIPIILETSKVPEQLSNFKYIDYSKTRNMDELISVIQPDYKTNESKWGIEVELKWIKLLEEGNEIKIKRQIFDLKDTIFDCFYEILELEGKSASIEVRNKFWNSINSIFIQLIVLIRFEVTKYTESLFNIIVDTYNQCIGPNPNLISGEPKGKQAEIWFGIIMRIYFTGAVALSLSKYKIVKKLIKIKPSHNYLSNEFWIRHAQVMFTRKRNIEDKNGVVYYANSYLQELYWMHRFLDPKKDETLTRLCEFDFLQCILAMNELNDTWSCYPSFGQYYSWRLSSVLSEIVQKNKSYSVVNDLSDNQLADTIISVDEYADKVYGFSHGYDRREFSDDVKKFIEQHKSK